MKKSIIFFILTLLSFFLGHILGRGMNILLMVAFPFIFWVITIYYATKEKETTGQALKTWFFYHLILLIVSIIGVFGLAWTTADDLMVAVILLFGIPIVSGIILGFAVITLIIALSRKKISEINLERKNQGEKSIVLKSFYISLIVVAIIEIIFMLINYNKTVKNFNRFIDNIGGGLYYPQAFNNAFYFFQEMVGAFLISFVIVLFIHYIISYFSYKKSIGKIKLEK